MKTLSLDTSTTFGSIALLDGTSLIAEVSICRPMNQLTWLAYGIEQLMKDAGWDMEMLEGIAAGCGPGSFTGLRIGIATAKAIAQTRRLPLVGVNSLDAVAYHGVSMHGTVCAMMRTRHLKRHVDSETNMEVYAAFYKSDGVRMVRTGDFIAESLEELAVRINLRGQPVTLIGDIGAGRETLLRAIKISSWYLSEIFGIPRAAHIGYLAYVSGEFSSKKDGWAKLEPLYLRTRDYTVPLYRN